MGYRVEKDWVTEAGLRAVVIMCLNGSGDNVSDRHRCGYVGVSNSFSTFGKEYDDELLDDIRVHGGLTYSAGHDTYPVESDLWWFGFDCAHCGDISYTGIPAIDDDSPLDFDGSPAVFRSLEYCADWCESLANQLLELEANKCI